MKTIEIDDEELIVLRSKTQVFIVNPIERSVIHFVIQTPEEWLEESLKPRIKVSPFDFYTNDKYDYLSSLYFPKLYTRQINPIITNVTPI